VQQPNLTEKHALHLLQLELKLWNSNELKQETGTWSCAYERGGWEVWRDEEGEVTFGNPYELFFCIRI
jgi:hypothetical protein